MLAYETDDELVAHEEEQKLCESIAIEVDEHQDPRPAEKAGEAVCLLLSWHEFHGVALPSVV